jgi:acyl-CoA oxidase
VNRIADLRGDCEVFTTFEGDNTVLAQLVAKSVLVGYQKQFSDGGALAVLRMIGKRVANVVVDPVLSRRTDAAHLRDRTVQLDALRYREQTLTASAAGRLRKRLGNKRDAEAAMLELQEHFLVLAEAYADRLAFEWFAWAEEAAPAAAKPALKLVGDLHGLALLERRAAWFLEDDHFEAAKARAIRQEVEALLGEVAAITPDLLAAFRLRDAIVAAPIAVVDPAHPRYE